MLRPFLLILVAAVFASQIPHLLGLTDLSGSPDAANDAQVETLAATGTASAAQNAIRSRPGSVTLSADRRGHFLASFRLNGKSVEGLVDTGASTIAINESTARRIGYGGSTLTFNHQVTTANGVAKAAMVRLDRVEIEGIRVRDVDALVLEDKALTGSLIGMSFLKRLSSFQIENGSLRLVQ